MPPIEISPDVVRQIAEAGRFASARGWLPATSGNLSQRLDARYMAITRSGIDKGAIGPTDLVAAGVDEPLPGGISAEAPLHASLYRANGAVGAVLHVHTISATVLSRADAARGYVELQGFEMLKAVAGITTHETILRLPVFPNDQDTAALAAHIETAPSTGDIPAYLLAGHGMYVWGSTMQDARRHLEGIEFLLQCVLEERRLQR